MLGTSIKKVLYKILPLESYLYVVSQLFFVSYKLGSLKNDKFYEYHHFLKNLVSPGDTCIDIGGNLGYMSLLLSRLVGEKGEVFSVEPVKPIFQVLKKNTKSCKNVTLIPYALGEENKTITLGNDSVSKNGYLATGSHSINDTATQSDITFQAEMKKGSEVFSDLEKIDFIKCDIEGYEVVVLKEMSSLIEKHRPVLLIESRKDNRKELIDYFLSKQFHCLMLKDGKLVPTTEKDFWDMLVVPQEGLSRFEKFVSSD